MTEEQRKYLADLANRKGVKYDGADGRSQSWASKQIDTLKAMPDKTFKEMKPEIVDEMAERLASEVIMELEKWTLTE